MIATQTDYQLGDLRWDDRFSWWEGLLALPDGKSFTLYVESKSKDDQSLTDEARLAASKIVKSDSEIRKFAASRLLATHNESWNEGDLINEEEFMRRMIPAGITIFADGDAEISYYDDDIFRGHYIEIRYRGGDFNEALVSG
jgi:hypothetical protein